LLTRVRQKEQKPIVCHPSGARTLALVRYYRHFAPIGALEIGVVSIKVQ
jgi:hypothetical protein